MNKKKIYGIVKRNKSTIFIFVVSILIIGYFTFLQIGDTNIYSVNLSDERREELQRYFGFEPLLYRYFTMPYDISINVNTRGDFVDLGFLFWMFFPVLILYFFRGKVLKNIFLVMGFIIFYFGCLSFSNIVTPDRLNLLTSPNEIQNLLVNLRFVDNPFTFMLCKVFLVANGTLDPLNNAMIQLTGMKDYTTYPILFFSTIIFAYFIHQKLEEKDNVLKLSILATIPFFFFWLILSSGIIWYGFFLFLLLFILLIFIAQRLNNSSNTLKRGISYIIIFFACIWISSGYVTRISNLSTPTPEEHLGKNIINPAVLKYALGDIKSEAEMLESTYPGAGKAIEEMNRDMNEKIIRIGTGFTYFIKNNHKRVVQDNQLWNMTQYIIRPNRTQLQINDLLKSRNVRFIIIDLQTASIDNTPEKSLTAKFEKVMRYVYQNPGLELLATDRVVNIDAGNGQFTYLYKVFGDVVNPGYYAIYKIK